MSGTTSRYAQPIAVRVCESALATSQTFFINKDAELRRYAIDVVDIVAVGCHRLPIRLFEPLSAPSHLRPVATGCARLAP